MCNLYRQDISQSKIISFFEKSSLSLTSTARGLNLEPGYVGADQNGPVLINDGNNFLDYATMRWGFPPVREGARPITNIRNLTSAWWRGANRAYTHDAEYRCLVPFSSFSEWDKASKSNAWFGVLAQAPMFAGVWRPWHGERLKKVEGKKRRERQVHDWKLFAFLTTEPNTIVAPIHPKAMPVILTSSEECEQWMSGGEKSFELQRPLPESLTKLAD
ncbi:SOS response-associated peptidase family protein [Hellea sp.]|nr:SOS response-associated peptidase family protein [Hellea sp.]